MNRRPTTESPHADEIFDLFDAYTRGELDEASGARLAELLTSDESARQQFVVLAHIGASAEQFEGRRSDEAAIEKIVAEAKGRQEAGVGDQESGARGQEEERSAVSDQPYASDTQITLRSKSWLNRASRHPKGPSIAIAAAVMVAVLLAAAVTPVGRWIVGGGEKDSERRQPERQADSEYVAILNNWHNAVWLEGTRPPLNDPRLRVGRQLKLASGLIEIKYNTGARVVLEGPAEFFVGRKQGTAAELARKKAGRGSLSRSEDEGGRLKEERGESKVHPSSFILQPSNAGFLALGKLVARVESEDAKGFTIATSNARIEDLGTEFGVDVHEDGAAEVVVLDGEVEVVRSRRNGVASQRVHLTKDQGAFVAVEDGRIIRREKVDTRLFAILMQRMRPEVVAQTGHGSSGFWTGSGDGSSWNDDSNWSGANYPDGADNDVTIGDNSHTNVTVNFDIPGGSATTRRFFLGGQGMSASNGNFTLNLIEGTFKNVNDIKLSENLNSSSENTTITVNMGLDTSKTIHVDADLKADGTSPHTGLWVGYRHNGNAGNFAHGNTATWNQYSGTVDASYVRIGGNGIDGTYNLSGGTLNALGTHSSNHSILIGFWNYSAGLMNITGGTLNAAGKKVIVDEAGRTNPSTGTFQVTGDAASINVAGFEMNDVGTLSVILGGTPGSLLDGTSFSTIVSSAAATFSATSKLDVDVSGVPVLPVGATIDVLRAPSITDSGITLNNLAAGYSFSHAIVADGAGGQILQLTVLTSANKGATPNAKLSTLVPPDRKGTGLSILFAIIDMIRGP